MKQGSSFIAVSIITSYDLDSLSDSDLELSIAEKCTEEAAGNWTLGGQRAELLDLCNRGQDIGLYSLSLHWWSMSRGTHGVIAGPRGPVALLLAWDTVPGLCLQSGMLVSWRNVKIIMSCPTWFWAWCGSCWLGSMWGSIPISPANIEQIKLMMKRLYEQCCGI